MRLYLRAVSYFKPDWPLLVVWGLLIVAATGVSLLAAWPMAVLIDSVLTPSVHNDWAHRLFLWPLPSGRVGQIAGLAVIGLLLKFAGDVLSMAQTIVCNQINYGGLLRVRCDLYRKLQALNLGYHRSQPQGDAIYRLSTDTFGCQNVLNVMVAGVVAVVTLLVMTGVLWARSGTLTVLAFSIMPPLAVLNLVYGRRLSKRSIECKEIDSKFTSVTQRALQCINLVQAFGREEEEFGQFHGTIRENIRAWWRLNREQITYNLLVGTLFGVSGAAIFGYGGYLAHLGKLSVGDLVVFTTYLGSLWGPLCKLTGFAADMQGGVAGARRVFEILDRDAVISDAPDAQPLAVQPRRLELDEVTFAYGKDSRSVLRGVSVKIEPGQMVAFVGPSGTGKSTLLNLLPRFYDPAEGAVRLDGIDVRKVKIKDLRRHVALVLQESVILPTTVAENIAYGRPHATRQEICRAAELAGADAFIRQLSDGYDTTIAENGANLSGGQRQRISIARALLTEAPFVVLDEPTSALDPHHERLITETLQSLKGRRTMVLVSHRLSTVIDCDQIFVMDGGKVVEQGTHSELLARRGDYYEMARHQLQLEDLPPSDARRAA